MARRNHIKEWIKYNIPWIFAILKYIKNQYFLYLGKHNPRLLIEKLYQSYYNEKINLETPVNIDEKINYLKLYSDTSLWSRCADKYEAREFVKERGLEFTLNELYGLYDSPEDIKFENLPDSFVIKTTNGGGGNSVMIVKNKNELNKKKAIKTLRKWLDMPVGYKYAELHYNAIKPRIVIEKYLNIPQGKSSLIDYKFNCFNGHVYSVFLCSDRKFGEKVSYSIYDLDWIKHPECVKPEYSTDEEFVKPKSFDKMVEYSSILSKHVPYVRVDWYDVDGNPVFGELTFTPAGGFQQFYSKNYLLELGTQMDITKC